jgi:hypothetical protein
MDPGWHEQMSILCKYYMKFLLTQVQNGGKDSEL